MQYSNKEKYVRYAIYAVLILIAMLLQSSNVAFPEIFGARAFLMIPLTIAISMHEREVPAAVFGAGAGVVWDSVSANEGFSTLLLMLLGAICSILISHLMRNNIITAFVLGCGAVAIYELLYIFVNIILSGAGGAIRQMLTFYLPSFIYTAAFIPVFYYIVRWIFQVHKATDE